MCRPHEIWRWCASDYPVTVTQIMPTWNIILLRLLCLFLATKIAECPHFFLQLSAGFQFHAFLWLCYPHFSCYDSLLLPAERNRRMDRLTASATKPPLLSRVKDGVSCDVFLLSVQFTFNYSYVADYKRKNIVEHVIRPVSLPSLKFLLLYNVR
jgi:hypothetical protein